MPKSNVNFRIFFLKLLEIYIYIFFVKEAAQVFMKMFGEEKGGNLESDCVMAAIESESMPLGI